MSGSAACLSACSALEELHLDNTTVSGSVNCFHSLHHLRILTAAHTWLGDASKDEPTGCGVSDIPLQFHEKRDVEGVTLDASSLETEREFGDAALVHLDLSGTRVFGEIGALLASLACGPLVRLEHLDLTLSPISGTLSSLRDVLRGGLALKVLSWTLIFIIFIFFTFDPCPPL